MEECIRKTGVHGVMSAGKENELFTHNRQEYELFLTLLAALYTFIQSLHQTDLVNSFD